MEPFCATFMLYIIYKIIYTKVKTFTKIKLTKAIKINKKNTFL